MVWGGITSKQRQHAFQNTFQRKNNNLYKPEILSELLNPKSAFVSTTDSIKRTIKYLGIRVLSEPHTLLDSLYLYNNNILDDESYNNLVMNIIKIHIAQANHLHDKDTVVIKPMFKCTPQIKIIKERYIYLI